MNKGLTYKPEHSGDCYIGYGCLLISGLSHPRVHQRPQLLAGKIKAAQMNIESHKQTVETSSTQRLLFHLNDTENELHYSVTGSNQRVQRTPTHYHMSTSTSCEHIAGAE